MSTALQLVNRVLIRVGENKVNDSVTFTSTAGEDALEFVNEAKRLILETRVWDFDRRQDFLPIYGKADAATVGVTNGSATITPTFASSTLTLAPGFRMRARITDDSTYGNTSYPMLSLAYAAAPAASGIMDQDFPGTTNAAATGEFFISEYQMPAHAASSTNSSDSGAKYRQVLSVRHQQEDCKLVHVDRDFDLDQYVPRLHDEIGNPPRVVFAGGKVSGTTKSAGATPVVRNGIAIWPVPDEDGRLDYTAVYRHPDLTIPEDELVDVDPAVEDLIVSLGAAKWLQSPGRDAKTGIALETVVRSTVQAVWQGTRRQPQERNPLRSLDHQTREDPVNFGRIPRNVGSL